jgi:periplasmic copper chaperone A
MMRRFLLLSAALGAVSLATATPAAAHIDPDPKEAQAGSTQPIAFTVEHGCDGSPTIQLDMRLPDGVTGAAPDPVAGWDGSIDDGVVTFVGGPLPDDTEGTFSVTMTLPPTPDTTIHFPFVQRCEVGEIRWIGIPAEPGDELDEPAPALLLTGPVAATTAPSTTAPATTEAATPTTAEAASTTVAITEPTEPSSATTEPLVIAEGTDEDADPNTGTVFFIASIVAVVVVAAFATWRARVGRKAAAVTES